MPTRLVAREPREKFEDPEGLRVLLDRLHAAGRGSWRADPEAAALMRHAAEKYAALAGKHGLDPWEAAAAAFDAMRTPSVRRAEDPWAMVTRAVQVTCIAEERANGLLCSVHQARRPRYSVFHDAERFSDRENLLIDYHPAFRVDSVEPDDEDESASSGPEPSTSVASAVEHAIALLAGSRASRGPGSSTSPPAWPSPPRARRRSRCCAATVTRAPCWTCPAHPGRLFCARCSAHRTRRSRTPSPDEGCCCAC